MGTYDLDEAIRRFFDGPRWFNTDAPRCESRVIIYHYLHLCECGGPHKYHAYVRECPAKAEDYERFRVIDDYVEALK